MEENKIYEVSFLGHQVAIFNNRCAIRKYKSSYALSKSFTKWKEVFNYEFISAKENTLFFKCLDDVDFIQPLQVILLKDKKLPKYILK